MKPVCVDDFADIAREKLTPDVWAFVSGGSADEITLRRNRSAFDDLQLIPRVMRGITTADTKCELLARTLEFPILLAPTALAKLVANDGELAIARAAASLETIFVQSVLSSFSIAEVAAEGRGRLWLQLYLQRDRQSTLDLVKRAEDGGFAALCLTVDLPCNPPRYREQRELLQAKPGMRPVNLIDPNKPSLAGPRAFFGEIIDPAITWEDLSWLQARTSLPVVVKGVLHPRDADLAVQAGARGIIVSNHGGRALDGAPATIVALPHVARAVARRVPVLVDGGIRRGTDIVKAIALGADAVLVGRPYLYALCSDGEDGVRSMLCMLRDELVTAMTLCGARSLADIDGDLLVFPEPHR